MILVPLIDLKSLTRVRSGWCRDFKSAVLACGLPQCLKASFETCRVEALLGMSQNDWTIPDDRIRRLLRAPRREREGDYVDGKQFSAEEIAEYGRRGQPPVIDDRIKTRID